MKLPISREDENRFPKFASYEDARMYFRERFGSDFILQTVEEIEGQPCYFHAVVVDWEKYKAGRLQLQRNGHVSGIEFVLSYQPVQIMQDGSVHVVH